MKIYIFIINIKKNAKKKKNKKKKKKKIKFMKLEYPKQCHG